MPARPLLPSAPSLASLLHPEQPADPPPPGTLLYRRRKPAPAPTAPTLPTLLPAAPAASPWRGTSVMFRHLPDGSVAATSRGRVGVGPDAVEALRRLEEQIRAAAPRTDPDLVLPP